MRTALIIEDEESNRSVFRAVIKLRGWHVLEAASGGQAQAVARAHEGPIDLVIADVVLSGENGVDVARALVSDRPETRCLFVSGFPASVLEERGFIDMENLPCTSSAFVQKPFTAAALLRSIDALLAAPQRAQRSGG